MEDIDDVIKQMDILLKKLNSDYVDEGVIEVYTNVNQILTKINNKNFIEGFNNLYYNIDKLTKNSKVFVNVNDNNWKLNEVLVLTEIFLVLLIIIIIIMFGFYIHNKYRIYKNINRNSPQYLLDTN
jgi:ABC-type glucose/galactose transport system permease subunit